MSQKENQQEERIVIPRRALIIKLLIAGLAIFWLAVLAGKSDLGCSSSEKAKKIQPSRPENRSLPYKGAKSEILKQSDESWLIKWTGEGEEGFRLPDLAPGRYSLTWISGKIVYSANGHSFPLWGADVYYKSNLRYFHLKEKGIRPHQVILIKGDIGSGGEELIPFRPGKTQILFRADARPLFLFYHFTRGEYDQFGWDGSYAVFQLERLLD